MKKIAILGSTGSMGRQSLDVARLHPDRFEVTALSCLHSIDLLEEQIREFKPAIAAVYDEAGAKELASRVADLPVRVLSGMEGLLVLAKESGADTLLTCIVGMIGIRPTVAALEAGLDIALANKETLVTAGHIIMPLAKKMGVKILPVDSEHSAIFQSLQDKADSKIRRILLTASGGPFFTYTAEQLKTVTAADALKHPTWTMGPKITIDSASMVNKGLEVMEAKWLFDVSLDQIEVVIQRESILHSAVEYEDSSIIGQFGPSDMRIAIQYALTYPDHMPSPTQPLDFTKLSALHFDQPRNDLFKGLPLAYEAMRAGGSMPTVYNAANEWANDKFRKNLIGFTDIYDVIEGAMDAHTVIADPDMETVVGLFDKIWSDLDGKFAAR
ncbi:MAG: 1-deoxy-D-xylulose-5-phosphate reductoisomerase [Lachnospiraceae bacterium]|nr:1-deoxy-D-xylulose-5-phosphate reductoisomerase [Lachnospiraceae bacterium]